MAETSSGLLAQARDPTDAHSWRRLVALYSPLLYGWLRYQSLAHQDADDLVQEVLAAVAMELPTFHHNGRVGAFRCWLRTILTHRLRAFRRNQTIQARTRADSERLMHLADQLEDPRSDLSRLWDEEHDRYLVRRLLDLVKPDFQPATWKIFERLMIEGAEAEIVATENALSVGAIYNIKYRILKKLRQVMDKLTD